jgi:hypothetical protein
MLGMDHDDGALGVLIFGNGRYLCIGGVFLGLLDHSEATAPSIASRGIGPTHLLACNEVSVSNSGCDH